MASVVTPVKFAVLIFLISRFVLNHQSRLVVDASLAESKEYMSGKVVRVAVFHYPPFMVIKKGSDGTLQFRGLVFDIINYFAQALDISYEYVFLKEEEIVKFGSGPTQFNMVANDEVDIAPGGVPMSHSKYQRVDFSVPWLIQPLRIVVPWPKEENQQLIAVTRPFQLEVWICIIFNIAVIGVVLTCIAKIYLKFMIVPTNNERNQRPLHRSIRLITSASDLGRNLMFVWSHLINHSYNFNLNSRRALYIVVGVFLLMTVVLANAYAGTLLSFLSVTKLGPVINSIDELAHSKSCKLIVQAGTDLTNQFLEAKEGNYKLIGDSFRENPGHLIYNFKIDEVKKKLVTGHYATIHLDLVNFAIIDAAYREGGKKCQLTMARSSTDSLYSVVQMLKKDSPYTKAINERLQEIIESGLIHYYFKKYVPRIDQCKMENQKPNARQKSLSLIDMSGAFLVFGFGLSLAFTIFLTELLCCRLRKNKKTRNDWQSLANQRQILAIEAPPPSANAPAANNDDKLPNTDAVIRTTADSIKQSSSVAAAAIASLEPIQQEENLDAITLVPLSAHHDGKQQAPPIVVNIKKPKQLEQQAANVAAPTAALNHPFKNKKSVTNTLKKQFIVGLTKKEQKS